MPPVDQTRWEATNTQSLECCAHLTRLPRSIQPFAAEPNRSSATDTRQRWERQRPPPRAKLVLPSTPLCGLAPFRWVVGLLAKFSSESRHEGAEGGAPPTAVPLEERARTSLDRNAKAGKQSHDQRHATAELRPGNRSPRIRFCGSPPLGGCVLAQPSAAPHRENQNHHAEHQHTDDVHHHTASKKDRTGELTCNEKSSIADYDLVLY